ncbi:MAG: energy-coupling factor transporter ATPase [Anaerolineae bacterium]|nr:energy-coupling factor transporter ATPase [Anaerolineae bacterium]MDH7475547.1 energy-coupling factor transporter ATPase [Anaerolineae bacterium]
MTNDPIISLQDVTFTYEGDVVALHNLNLTARKGEFVVVLGANGAGKSTLCYLISGIVPHIYGGRRRGRVSVAGLDPWDEPLYATAQRCGVLMQDPEVQLFMPTLKAELAFGPANLGVPRDEISKRSREALALVRLEGLEEHNPRDLSGGQKQRAALAAVLTMNPQVLVLDEPTSQLDPLGRWEVVEAIERLKQKGDLTIIMTTHETEEILRLADQVLVLERGEAVLQGTPSQVFTQAERLEEAGVKTPALIQVQSRLSGHEGDYPEEKQVNLTISAVAQRARQAIQAGRLVVRPAALPSLRPVALDRPVILEARDLTVEYPGPPPVVALRGVNVQIRQGEFVGIVGQNGSGKSTLVKCFVGLLKPRQGEVLFKGESIRKLSIGEIARRVGLVLQNPDYQLFTASCRDEIRFGLRNVGVPAEEIEQRVEETLRMVGLSEEADLFPFRLSFGDRRKLAVAATMALGPEVLIMDEPTTAQDHRGRYQLAELARRFHEEKQGTVLMITHDVDLIARYAHRLIVLYQGQVLLDGPTPEVFGQVEELKKSFVVPPVAAQLAAELAPLGVPPHVMTLEELWQVLVPQRDRGGE